MVRKIYIMTRLSILDLKRLFKKTIQKGFSLSAFLQTVQNFFKGLNEQFQAYFKKDLKNAVDFFNFINQGDLTTANLSFLQAARLLLTYYPSKQIFNELYDGYAIDMLSSKLHTQPDTVTSIQQQHRDNAYAKFFIFQTKEIQDTSDYNQLRKNAKKAYADLSFLESIKLLVINPFIRLILGLKELYQSTTFNFKNYAANDIRKLSTAQATLYFVAGFLFQIVASAFLLTSKIWNSFKENFKKFTDPEYFFPLFQDAVDNNDQDKLNILFEEGVVEQEWITNACINAAKMQKLEIVQYLLQIANNYQLYIMALVLRNACAVNHLNTLNFFITSTVPHIKCIISHSYINNVIMTLLQQAVKSGHGAIVEALLKHKGISATNIQELIKMRSDANLDESDTIRLLLQEKLKLIDTEAATSGRSGNSMMFSEANTVSVPWGQSFVHHRRTGITTYYK